jgi:hypothetical protein
LTSKPFALSLSKGICHTPFALSLSKGICHAPFALSLSKGICHAPFALSLSKGICRLRQAQPERKIETQPERGKPSLNEGKLGPNGKSEV